MRTVLLALILVAAFAGVLALLLGGLGGGSASDEPGDVPPADDSRRGERDPRAKAPPGPERDLVVSPPPRSGPPVAVHRTGDVLPVSRDEPSGWEQRPVPAAVLRSEALGQALLDWVGTQGTVRARDGADLEALVAGSYDQLRTERPDLGRVLDAWRQQEVEVEVRYPLIFVWDRGRDDPPPEDGEAEPPEWPPPER